MLIDAATRGLGRPSRAMRAGSGHPGPTDTVQMGARREESLIRSYGREVKKNLRWEPGVTLVQGGIYALAAGSCGLYAGWLASLALPGAVGSALLAALPAAGAVGGFLLGLRE